MEVGPNGKTQWCPLEYEFLPNFCYICGLLGHVDRECSRGSWKEKKKLFGPELRVWPSRRRDLEDSRSRNSRSSGSGGQKSEGDSGSPTRKGWIVGSGSGSGKSVKGSVDTGEHPTSPLNQKSPHQLLAGAKKLILSDDIEERGPRKVGEGERSANEDCGDLAEKVSLSTTKRAEFIEDEHRDEKENESLNREGKSTMQSNETDPKEHEMEVDDFSLTNPRNQLLIQGVQPCHNKRRRTVKKVKRVNKKIVEPINHNGVKKRGCDEMEEGNKVAK